MRAESVKQDCPTPGKTTSNCLHHKLVFMIPQFTTIFGGRYKISEVDHKHDMLLCPRASPGQNSEAAHPANHKRRLLGTGRGQLSVLSCLTFGSCRIGLPLAAPSGNHACWDFFLLEFLVQEDFLNWLE